PSRFFIWLPKLLSAAIFLFLSKFRTCAPELLSVAACTAAQLRVKNQKGYPLQSAADGVSSILSRCGSMVWAC
ncbi:MAG: hypothetical protein NWQ55_11965, partial [Salibacteraceae bacterium]|nr:hypothetical protein [Salibacteraceae bacterium]